MKKLKMTTALAAIAAAMTGCHTAHIEVLGDGKWDADIYDNLVRREIKSFTGTVKEVRRGERRHIDAIIIAPEDDR